MKPVDMHPPAERRCQIYSEEQVYARCSNEGTEWHRWGGCNCPTPNSDVCENDFYSWECSGAHRFDKAAW